jgi:hypothetical protein
MTTAVQEIRRFHRFTQIFGPLKDAKPRRPSCPNFFGLTVSANLCESVKSVDYPLPINKTTTGRSTARQKFHLGSLCGWEGEAPAEPQLREDFLPRMRLGRSLALPNLQIHKLASLSLA